MDTDAGTTEETKTETVTEGEGESESETVTKGESETEAIDTSDFTVSHDGTALVTLHEGTDTTARSAATTQLADTLEDLAAASAITEWAVGEAAVYEPPAAPFDPYTVVVEFTVVVTVTAADGTTAESMGSTAIDDVLEAADIDVLSDLSAPDVSVS